MTNILIFALIGIVAGTFAGLCGIGGGVVIIPCLMFIAGFSQPMATGTSLAVLLPPIGIAAVLAYYKRGQVDLKAGIIIAIFLVLSSWLSASLAPKVPAGTMKII